MKKNLPPMFSEDVTEIAKYAYDYVPLYIELIKEYNNIKFNFFNLPYVDKKNYANSTVPYISQKYMSQYAENKLIHDTTSGSTGIVTDYYWDANDQQKSLLELWYLRKKYYNINPNDKLCMFDMESSYQTNAENTNVLTVPFELLYNSRTKDAYKLIYNFRPKWMILQPSTAWMICKAIQTESLPILDSIAYIEFTGEFLETSIKKQVETTFHCQTANQYGIREANSIAYECPYGHMHIMRKNAYVEIINEDNNIGDICITSLQNKAMPYIRYNTGDKGSLDYQKCPCGNKNPILNIYNGRKTAWLIKNNGDRVHPFLLLRIFSVINDENNNCIIQYQIRQKDYNYLQIRLVVNKKTDRKRIENKFCNLAINILLTEFFIEFNYFEELIPDNKTGKIAAFICEIE